MEVETTYVEHVRWCKERAIRALEYGGPHDAMASLCSDFGKHPETEALQRIALIGALTCDTDESARRFIDGFNDRD